MASFMRRAILGFLAMMPLAASAIPVVNSTSCAVETTFNCVTGIDDLEILGNTYDLSVVVGTFNSLFSDPASQLLSWGNEAFALQANLAITAALNASPLDPTFADTKFFDVVSSLNENILHLPTNYNAFLGNPQGSFDSQCPNLQTFGVSAGRCGVWVTNQVLAFGLLSPVEPTNVPEPGTLALFSLILAGLGLMRRRRKV